MIFIETTEYTLDGAKQELPGFDEKYVNIVDYILKITDEIWEKRAIWVIYDTYENDVIIHIGAGQIHGIESVVSGTIKTLSAFPDRKMGGEAVIWSKDDENTFFSSHRIASTATNLGGTNFGEATGKKVFFRTIADCMIRENRIYEEWLVRDNLSLIQQLGFDPVEMAKQAQLQPQPQLQTQTQMQSQGKIQHGNEASGLIFSLFEKVWKSRDFEKLSNYYTPASTIHAICNNDLQSHELGTYLKNLLACFPDFQLEIQRITCNEKSDEIEVAARWKLTGTHTGDGFFSPASGKQIVMPGISHYIIKGGKIAEEWMVFDGFDVLCQIHSNEQNQQHNFSTNGTTNSALNNKKTTLAFINELNNAANDQKTIIDILKKYISTNITLEITKPFEKISGIKGFADNFWLPLLHAFPDLKNEPYILIGGHYENREYVSFTGNFVATWEKDWLGIPATNQPTWLRYSTTFLFEKNKIINAWYFFDVLDVMRQAGFSFFPSKGVQHVPPAPTTGDGIKASFTDKKEGQITLDLTNTMLNALGDYDKKTLESMGQTRFWDVQNMMWYGPGGIGTTRGLKDFENNHQIPFLLGFPDRGITPKKRKNYFAQIGDGNYSCDFGFPAMYGTHSGNDWLGLKATGKKITLRVVDYWRREGDRLVENWVMIDMVHILEQLGIDVFELLKKAKSTSTSTSTSTANKN